MSLFHHKRSAAAAALAASPPLRVRSGTVAARMSSRLLSCVALTSLLRGAFCFPSSSVVQPRSLVFRHSPSFLSSSSPSQSSSWSVTDDWNELSRENPRNGIQSEDVFNQVLADKAARAFESSLDGSSNAKEEAFQDPWLRETFDRIYQYDDDHEDGITDTIDKLEDATDVRAANADYDETKLNENQFLEEMGEEISLLVRCNEDPTQLLIQSGRALPPLTRSERDDLTQLLDPETWEPTVFLTEAVASMFHRYSSKAGTKSHRQNGAVPAALMDRNGVSEWFAICSGKPVGPHDPRVQSILSRFGEYGRGALTQANLLELYRKAIVGDCSRETTPWSTLQRVRTDGIAQVWRDIRRHGILGPVELERQVLAEQLASDLKAVDGYSTTRTTQAGMLLDECEIVDDQYLSPKSTRKQSSGPKSSHQLVELADDGKTPLYMQDGDFVFIDEASCIGCTQCVLAAPGSFHMTEHDGRARAFFQRKSPDVAAAVSTCPVDCMHYVGYRELKTLETARDRGDGRSDHQHFGHSDARGWIPLTPLHVAGRASDSNHKSSWYHYLRNKCYKSKECPQRGCFDCPMHQSDPYANPHFQKRQREANHVRAQHYIRHGLADSFRKTAEL